MSSKQKRPNVKEILAHPSFPETVWNLTPSRNGKLPVAAGRGGPLNIDWEVHGTGNIKLVFIMGLGGLKTNWQRQTLKFGHDEGHKYSCLIFDNRGIGKSEKPLMRYSTSEMAKDTVELLDHVGWKSNRQLHIAGVSMGGMIAQELACLIPDRICSLNLISTAASLQNSTSFVENMQTRIRMLVPKSLDRSITESSKVLFAEEWLSAPDSTIVPTADSPNVILPPSGKYGKFSTNFERYAAHELCKRMDPELFERKGFLLQLVAAVWHHKSPEQLKEIGDRVGRERIMVVHGTEDRTITVLHAHKLIESIKPDTSIIKEGVGHVLMLEDFKLHDELIENMVEKCESLK